MSRATIELEGFIASDPERRTTQAGETVLGFSVAHTPRRRNKQTGEWEDAGPTSWFRVSLWRDDVDKYASLRKGTLVVVKGEPVVRAYDGKEGAAASIDVKFARVSVIPQRDRGHQAPAREEWAPEPPEDAWATPGLYGDDQPF